MYRPIVGCHAFYLPCLWLMFRSIGLPKEVIFNNIYWYVFASLDSTDDTCSPLPTSRFIRLPSDCIQQNINRAKYDVGTCGQAECYSTKTDQTTCADSLEEFNCCQPAETEIVNVQCEGYTIPVSRVISCRCGLCSPQFPKIIGRVVEAESGDDLGFIEVYFNSTRVTSTDGKGVFSYEFPGQVRRVALTLKDIHFHRVIDTTVVFDFSSDVITYNVFKMKRMPTPITLQQNVENCLPLGGEGSNAVAEIVIAPNSMYDTSGKKYIGQFNATVMNVDMRNVSDAEIAPGDFTTVDAEGNLAELRSFGMFALSFTDMLGNPLSVGGSSMVRVNQDMIPDCSFDEDDACDTSLWVFNERSGSWEKASSLTRSGKRRRRQGNGIIVGELDTEPYRYYNIDDLERSVRCWAKVISYTSDAFDALLPNHVAVKSVIREEGNSFLRISSPGAVIRNAVGLCVPQACDTTNPNDSKFTTNLTATYNGNELIPAQFPNPTPNFSLEPSDIDILQYQTSGAKLVMKSFSTDDEGPVFGGKYSQCDIAGTEKKHFQFHCPTCVDIICNTIDSASNPPKLTYLTFYPQLSFDKSAQEYCFIGLRINTADFFVRVIARSDVGTFNKTTRGTHYGSREIVARKNNARDTFIDACMEFKCSGDVYNPIDTSTADITRVTIEIKDAGNCRVVQVAPDFGNHINTPVPFDLPLTFDDPKTYGQRQGIHQKDEPNNLQECANDVNSPQTTGVEHCQERLPDFVHAVEINCTK